MNICIKHSPDYPYISWINFPMLRLWATLPTGTTSRSFFHRWFLEDTACLKRADKFNSWCHDSTVDMLLERAPWADQTISMNIRPRPFTFLRFPTPAHLYSGVLEVQILPLWSSSEYTTINSIYLLSGKLVTWDTEAGMEGFFHPYFGGKTAENSLKSCLVSGSHIEHSTAELSANRVLKQYLVERCRTVLLAGNNTRPQISVTFETCPIRSKFLLDRIWRTRCLEYWWTKSHL